MTAMEWAYVVLLALGGVLLVGLAGVGALVLMQRIETARRRVRLRAEQYRAEAELQHLAQRAMAEMLQTARWDARLRSTPPPTASHITPSPFDIEGEAWDSDG